MDSKKLGLPQFKAMQGEIRLYQHDFLLFEGSDNNNDKKFETGKGLGVILPVAI